MIRGWELILPGCGGTPTSARGATLDARRLHEPQEISNQPDGLGFSHLAGGIDPGDLRFRPRVVEVVQIWKELSSGDWKLSSPGAAGPQSWPEGQLSPSAGSMSPSQSAITQGDWRFHTLRGGIDRGVPVPSAGCWS